MSLRPCLRPLFRSQPFTRLAQRPPTPLRSFLTTSPLLNTQSSSPSEPALLPRFKADLKTSMRAKDKPRLDTLRSLLAAITNASKTSKPISTNKDLLSLLQSHIKASTDAIDNFQNAKRDDLVAKEQAQLDVLREYEGLIEVVGAEEVDLIVGEVVAEMKKEGGVNVGKCMGRVMQSLGGKPVDMKYVKGKVEEVCNS